MQASYQHQGEHLEPFGKIRALATRVTAATGGLLVSPVARKAFYVAVLCYAGARTGIGMRFPGETAAVVFLPYAVLIAALVTSPPKHWWAFILSSSLGNIVGHASGGAVPTFALLTELANVTRGLVAAAGMRRFGLRARKLDDLRSTSAFLVFAVGVGPCVGAFIGAAAVTFMGASKDFWLIWEEWFLSNALTAVAIVPVALGVLWKLRHRNEPSASSEGSDVAKRLEAIVVALATAGVVASVFAFPQPDLVTRPTRLYLPMPLLLWAAVRFRPTGTGSAILGVSALTIWGALHGRGPFVGASPADNLLNLQLFLIALSLPLILLASLVVQSTRTARERSRAEDGRRQLEAERRIALTLQEADRRKDEFLAILAHELRNPLAPTGIALELLRRQTPPDSAAARTQDVIGRQLRHMTRLVDDLLDISRITRGTIELRLESIDLRDVVIQGLETARPDVDAKHHELVVLLPDAPLRVRGDAIRLAQIVGNLVHNAARYTKAAGRIEVSARHEGGGVVLCVRDNGAGIPSDMIETIFDLFVQVRDRYTTSRNGLGIGLSLVKRLTELHGGTVVAESGGTGQGSAFTVLLPALPGALLPIATAPTQSDDSADVPLEILVVDDNVDAAEALAALLGAWGHTTHLSHDGITALEVARALMLDVVLLDLDLPKIDGFDVASSLRLDRCPEELMLVALSGFGSAQHRERAKAAGFDHHFVKPVDIPALRALLRQRAGRPRAAPSLRTASAAMARG